MESFRRMAKRCAGARCALGRLGFTASAGWESHTPAVLQSDAVFASRWPLGQETLWTIVNRAARNVSGAQLRRRR